MSPRLKLTLFTAAALLALSLLVVSWIIKPQPDTLSFARIDKALSLRQDQVSVRAAKASVPVEPKKDQSHIHVAVRIAGVGTLWLAPENLGLTERGQELAIHTHDATGVVHLHRPRGVRPFTLSQVMAVWGVPLTGRAIAGFPARILVNGRQQGPSYQLKDRDDVIIEIEDPSRLPKFDWDAVPLEAK